MHKLDRIIFGDNQFFGINHMSQEKAQQLAEAFRDPQSIYEVYDMAIEAGIKGIMLNSHERSNMICDYFRKNDAKYGNLNWYPSIPYARKYSNLVAEKGIFPAINEVIIKNNTAMEVAGIIVKGGKAILTKDAIMMMQMLIDAEMKMFRGLRIKVVFLQNIVTDLFMGFDLPTVFNEYCYYIRTKYNALPGLITQNLPWTLDRLKKWNIRDVVLCTSFNKIGYLMSPTVQSYVDAAKFNDPNDYILMAMSTMASGAIPADEAFKFINSQNIQSVVFGASSKNHIFQTVKMIHLNHLKAYPAYL